MGTSLEDVRGKSNVSASQLPLAGEAHAGSGADEVKPLTPMRRLIAERMRKSKEVAADITLTIEVDMTACGRYKQRLADEGTRVSYTAILVAAVARVLQDHRDLNSSMDGGGIVVHSSINVAVAVDTPEGVVAPVVRHADQKTVPEIDAEVRVLADRARARSLAMDDLAGATFTVSNLGQFGIDAFTPIIPLPQCAILGVGRIAPRPAVTPDGAIAVRPLCVLSLTCDHRIVDGAPAARFLAALKRVLESFG